MSLQRIASAVLLSTTATVPFDSTTLSSLTSAAAALKAGELVAFPTETVYGLGASALSSTAVAGIFKAKGRPSDNPLIVHVSSKEMLWRLLPDGRASVPKIYEPLMERFWPGPLSLIFPLSSERKGEDQVVPEVLAGSESLAVRMPSHPLALELIRRTGLPLAAPSANLSSRPSPTTAQHVLVDLGDGRGVTAILDGGECSVGVESTVIDWIPSLARNGLGEVRVLRAGGVSAAEIENCLNEAGMVEVGGLETAVKVYYKDFKSKEMEERPSTPGMKYKHYSPTNAQVILVKSVPKSAGVEQLGELIASYSTTSTSIGLMLTTETLNHCGIIPVQSIVPACDLVTLPSLPAIACPLYSYSLGTATRPEESAQRLFAGLRYFDSLLPASATSSVEEGPAVGVSVILLESIEEKGVGLAVMERSRKAAGGREAIDFWI